MTYTVVVRRLTAADLEEAYGWYEMQQAGLGRRFLDEIEAYLERISQRPESYAVALRDARRALVRRFPYSIYYRVRTGEIRVLAVIHQSRNPRVWQRRVR